MAAAEKALLGHQHADGATTREQHRRRMLTSISDSLENAASKPHRVVTTDGIIPRADTEKRSEHQVYESILSEAFRRTRIPLTDGSSSIIIAETVPASPHTKLEVPTSQFVKALSGQEDDYEDTLSGTYGDHLPTHTLTWAVKETSDGDIPGGKRYEAVSFFDLAKLEEGDRIAVTTHFARSMAREARLLRDIIGSQDFGGETKIVSSAAAGFHSMDARREDGLSRGSASNRTAHAHAVAFPDLESDTEEAFHTKRGPESISTDLLLKDADPLSRLFAEVAKDPMTEQLSRIFDRGHVSPIDSSVAPDESEQFPFGWKVTFDESMRLSDGLNATLTFLGEMETLWTEGKKICDENTDNAFSRLVVQSYIGDEGLAMLQSLKPTKHRDEKTRAEAAKKLAVADELMRRTNPEDVNRLMKLMLFSDRYRDIPRVTIPGQPSFNFFFTHTGDGEINEMHIVPALSEKSVAENITGAVMSRPEKRT